MKVIRDFERKVRQFTDAIPPGKIIVGVSGGADSVALLASLVAVGRNCIAAHCNFALRGEESDRDMRHAVETAKRLGADCRTITFNVPEYMTSHKCSLETACRELRYEWFEKLRIDNGAKWIAVAHHRDDNNETFLLNLMRGTGISGLRGMLQVNGRIIRPFLTFTRKEIERYLTEKRIGFVTDSSNAIPDVSRNKIRNTIMPVVRKDFPNADKAIETTISNLYSTEIFINEMMENEKKLWIKEDTIDVRALVEARKSAIFILFELIRDMGFNYEQCEDMIRCVKSGASGKVFENRDGKLYCIDRGRLIPVKANDCTCEINIETVSADEFKPGQDRFVEYFDTKILEGAPLSIRKWQVGDRMSPYGMKKGSRLISDIMRDARYSLIDKDNTWLLAKEDKILWVIGLRRSSLYPVAPETENIVRISANLKRSGSE